MNVIKIVPLDTAANVAGVALGAKAANLIRMRQAGLPVPHGFCIPAAACREHLAARLQSQITAALTKLENAALDDKRNILADIRQTITDVPLDATLRDLIENHYRMLAADTVAVRSSATAEDLPHQSFAGQYDTFLNVGSADECIQCVKKCWASLWTERAFHYRRQNGIDHIHVEMAVIVQQMVTADVSGIIFTADPITGDRNRIVIEAARGSGENIVQGKTTPDRFVLKKPTLKIANRSPAQPDHAPCIDDSTAESLGELALKVERLFDCPQDIEWAAKDRHIWLLQARPITTLQQPTEKTPKDRLIWSYFPAQEVLPDVVTPATKSVLDTTIDSLVQPVFDMLCIDRCDYPIYDYIAGRAYFNASIWITVMRSIPFAGRYDFMKAAGSDSGLQKVINLADEMSPEHFPPIKFNKFRFLLKLPFLAVRIFLAGSAKGQAFIADGIARNEGNRQLDPASMTTEQITARCSDLIGDVREFFAGVFYLCGVFAAFPALEYICQKWLAEPTCAGRLVAGLGNMTDAEAALDLWRLAQKANAIPELRKRLLEKETWADIATALADNPDAAPFLEAWDDFMHNHGHHCRGEIELANPRWSERPDYILGLIRGHLLSIEQTNPIESHIKAANQRRQLERDCRGRLKNPVKRFIFNRLLIRAQKGSVWRENIKSELIKPLFVMRKMLLELGKRLCSNSTLDNADDIFFLRIEELESVAKGVADFDVKQRIAARREEHDKWTAMTPPNTIVGTFVPDDYVPDLIQTDAQLLKGFGVSPGTATGKARVILRTDTEQQLLPGEVLVAPFTDPGWTPYFVPAAAVVTERGGILSHGAIVARELGIPGVTNVGPATKIIKTGQLLQVDGNAGTVRIIN